MNRIATYVSQLIEFGIASKGKLQGCSEIEIRAIETRYGRLDPGYKEILRSLGKSAGHLINPYEFSFYYPHILRSNQEFRAKLSEIEAECLAEGCPEEVPSVPGDYFIISARYGVDTPHFLLTNSQDSTVYFMNDDGETKPSSPDVWDWLEGFIDNALFELRRGHRY